MSIKHRVDRRGLTTLVAESAATMMSMRTIRESHEDEMVAVFLQGELTSRRFGSTVRKALRDLGTSETLGR